ncbi:MAG: hypothetical protein GC179_01155 [Anaerolineaceae bacterium]|nr:hypothetical protein [Anaerolineaceae bacterium]
MAKHYRWLIGIMVLSLVILSGRLLVANAAGCDGTTGNDTINCTTNPVNPDQIDGDLGDDTITQAAGVTTSYIDSDGQPGTADAPGAGNGGNDVVVNNGTVTVSISGDYVTGLPGNDHITNNGTTGDILGDETYDTTAKNGDDVIVNNGTVTGTLRGDGNATINLEGGSGGNDTITNNGTIGKDIVADSGSSGVGGNDNITNNGSVGGNIDAGGGNDTVTIGDGATVGGTIDGGAGTDVLKFNFNNPTEGAAAAATLAGMSPAGGTATFGGRTYTWTNFEQLQAIFAAAAVTGQPVTVSVSRGQIKDGRLNGYDLGAPFAVYCVANEYIQVIDIRQDGSNPLAFKVNFDVVNGALKKAQSTFSTISIASGEGDFLSATQNGSLVAYGPTLDGSKIYKFTFQPDCSASAAGVES